MKKKIINGIMMVALVAATSTSFVSCKDTNEDVRIEQAAEIAALQDRLDLLEAQYGDLNRRVTDLRNDLNKTDANVERLTLRCDQLEVWLAETFAKLVTSVEINATWNNMTGMVAIPGVKANMLIANYGTAGKGGKFPVEGQLVDADEQLNWNAGTKFGYSEARNTYAGTIYATVNKYINDELVLGDGKFGAQLVKTSGENIDDYITIGLGNEGKPTDKDLTWGWTRADNNIYEFEIGVKGNPEELGFNILKVEGLKDDLKNIWQKRASISAEEFAQAVAKLYYTAVQGGVGSNMPMYALRLGWTTGKAAKENEIKYKEYDQNGTATEKSIKWTQPEFMNTAKHFVQSDADLLLATLQPLAFTTKDVPVKITPKVQMTLDEAEKIFNRMVASVNSVVSRAVASYKGVAEGKNETEYSLQDMMVTSIVADANAKNHLIGGTGIGGATLAKGQIYYVEGATAADAPYYIYSLISGTNTVALPAGANGTTSNADFIYLNPFFAEYLGTQANAVNRAIELVQEALNYASNGNLFKNKIADRILNYSASADKWLGENFNNGLQPTLFAIHGIKNGTKILQTINSTDVKLNRVSGIKDAPLYVKADGTPVILKATSYTLETFAPIMAKFVTVTEVSDGKETKTLTPAEAEALSEKVESKFVAKFGHVIDSYIDQYAFIPEKGKKYTILYEAVDYFGNTTSKYYFIQGE